MAIKNIVNLSELEFGNRIDGELYNPNLKLSHTQLRSANFQIWKLKEFCTIKSGTTPIDRDDSLSSGPILFKTTDIRNAVLDPYVNYYHISEKIFDRMAGTKLLEKDILLNIVGATHDVIGRTAYTSNYFQTANITQAMVLLRVKKNIKPGYLFSFLNTKYAQDQIKRYARPTGQYNLNLNEVGHIEIPIIEFKQQEIVHELIENSGLLQKSSSELYQQATDLLNKELGLNDIVFENKKSYTARFSEVVSNRMDAEFFNQELLNYYSFFKESGKELIPITELTKVLKFSNPDYSKEGAPIITQRHLSSISPENYGDFPIASLEWLKKNPTAVIREDDLLFYSVGAYLGKTNIWFNKDQAVHASFITMLRCQNSFDAGYLMVLLNSKFGILQSKVYQSGSSQPYIYPKDIKQFLVPQINDELKMELYRLIKDSFNAKRESKRLLEQAKLRVEQLIEEAANKH